MVVPQIILHFNNAYILINLIQEQATQILFKDIYHIQTNPNINGLIIEGKWRSIKEDGNNIFIQWDHDSFTYGVVIPQVLDFQVSNVIKLQTFNDDKNNHIDESIYYKLLSVINSTNVIPPKEDIIYLYNHSSAARVLHLMFVRLDNPYEVVHAIHKETEITRKYLENIKDKIIRFIK